MTGSATKPPTQDQLLLELLRDRGEQGVTPLLALDRIGSFRLASRVHELRALGHDIETRSATTTGGARIACYVLHERPAQLGLSL